MTGFWSETPSFPTLHARGPPIEVLIHFGEANNTKYPLSLMLQECSDSSYPNQFPSRSPIASQTTSVPEYCLSRDHSHPHPQTFMKWSEEELSRVGKSDFPQSVTAFCCAYANSALNYPMVCSANVSYRRPRTPFSCSFSCSNTSLRSLF